MSSSLWSHGLQHAELPYPSVYPTVCSNSCPLNHWCHPNILSSVTLFSTWPQSFPGSFPINQLFASVGQSTGASASASVLPMNFQGWFPSGLTGFIFYCLRDSQESSRASQFESTNSSVLSLPYDPTLTSVLNTGKNNHSLDYTEPLLASGILNVLSGFLIAFPPRSKCLNFMAVVTVHSDFGAQENQNCLCFHFSPIYSSWSDETRCHDLHFFECWVLSQPFHSPLSLSSRGSLLPLCFLP